MEETKCYCGHTTYCDCGPETLEQKTTLEEAAIYNYKELYEGEPLTQDGPIDAFKQGAKWQQERSYSEEEVYDLILKAIEDCYDEQLEHHYAGDYRNLKIWFEQFKKK